MNCKLNRSIMLICPIRSVCCKYRDRSLRCATSEQRRSASDHSHHPSSATTHYDESSSSSSSSTSSSSFHDGPLHERYYEIIHKDTIDPVQLRTLQSLERLRYDLLHHHPPVPYISSSATTFTNHFKNKNPGTLSTTLSSWFGFQKQPQQQWKPPPTRGVYIHGGVGCGKTFLMNTIFYESLHNTIWEQHRQKTHFHTFMLSIHQHMHHARQQAQSQQRSVDGDTVLRTVVETIVQNGQLICFDEFQVTDVADALLLQRLFTVLWDDYNCIVVATSNRAPDDLYLNGLQRDRFVPFLQQLKMYCESVSMWESEQDYRLILRQHDDDDHYQQSLDRNSTPTTTVDASNNNSQNGSTNPQPRRVYFEGGKEVWKNFDRFFYTLIGSNRAVAPTTLQTQGRNVTIPQASLSKGICRFTFEDLCTKALGAADYFVVGQHFHTVFVDNVPVLKLEHINWVRRFIIFVDAMYECNCKLILHAKTAPADIFQTGFDDASTSQIDEVFAFQRTVSRLHEMSSQTYLQKQQKVSYTNADKEDPTYVTTVESKASLLSHRKAYVSVTSS